MSRAFLTAAVLSFAFLIACSEHSSSTDAGTALTDAGTAFVDPAPGKDTPGKWDSPGAPTTTIDTFTINAGSASYYEFSGTVVGASGDGEFYAHGQGELAGVVPTDSSGAFRVTVPLFCGIQLVKLVWHKSAGDLVLVFEVTRESCQTAGIQLTITWDAIGDDWELHLIKEGGKINDDATDCTWTSCISSRPDWGVPGEAADNPKKDVDDIDAYGPENIYLQSPANGRYTVMVEHWGTGDPGSDGQVIFNVAGKSYVLPLNDFAPQHLRLAGTIDWPAGTVTLSGADYDCSGSWNRGCTASIPPLP